MLTTKKTCFILIVVLFQSLQAAASKIELAAGAFQFSGSNNRNNTSSSVSNIGSYRVAYRKSFLNEFEYELGYSLVAAKTFGGDLSFGFDLGVNYFPYSYSDKIEIKTENVQAEFSSLWRPFVGFGFVQRNFQSISSQYAGVSFRAGADYQWKDNLSLVGSVRLLNLLGPSSGKASQIDVLFGIAVDI